MVSKQFTLSPRLSLNVKTAKKVAAYASRYDSKLYIEYGGICVSLKSVMEVALMEIPDKSNISLKAKGEKPFIALLGMGCLLENGFESLVGLEELVRSEELNKVKKAQ